MDKLRLIQCGMGGMGKHWWKNVTASSPDFELVSIVDVADGPLHESGNALDIPYDRRFKTLEDALQKGPRADAVLTVTPPSVHVEHARLAFDHGLHVLTEKPIADTLENAKTMVRLAQAAGRQLVVAQNYRYNAPVQKIKQLVAEQIVGEFGHGKIDFYIAGDFTGTFRETMRYPLLVDMAIHHVDLIRCVTGKNITRVTAHTFNPPWSWYKHHAGLHMLLELEGALPFTYSGDWSARGRSTGWNGLWRLQCADGAIHLEDDRVFLSRSERWHRDPSLHPVDTGTLSETGQHALLRNFAAAIRSDKPAETSGEDNLWSFAAVMAGIHSAETGATIDVAQLLD